MEERMARVEQRMAQLLERDNRNNRRPRREYEHRDDMRNSGKRPSTPHPTQSSQSKGRESEKRVPRKDVTVMVCNRCNGFGHMKAECPNKRAFTANEWKDIRAKSTIRIMLAETEDGSEGLFEEDDGGNLMPYVEEPVHERSSEARETENVGELLPLRAGEDIGSVEQGTESLQGKESEGIQETPRNDVIRTTMRKFEVFETLFDPPKFIPEFMKPSMVNDVEATKFVQRDDEAAFIEGICEEDRSNMLVQREAEVLFFNNEVPSHVIKTYALGYLAVIEFDLNKIRGRIFLKKGRMSHSWVHELLLFGGCILGSTVDYRAS